MRKKDIVKATFQKYEGIFRLMPNFLPRNFAKPGHRLRLHPDDYFPLGTARGAIKERWFSSVVAALNGDLSPADEGLSYVAPTDNMDDKFLFKDACDELKAELIGDELYKKYGTWPMFAKFFDYATPLFHHLHLRNEDAALIGRLGKPEAYYFPWQYNNYPGEFPVTYFGFDSTVTKNEVRERLLDFGVRNTNITELSRAYRIALGTGWYTPPGVVHAPGSILTYEPQWNSDVNSIFENVVSGEVYGKEYLTGNCPEDRKDDIDFIMNLMDWEKNVDPDYRKTYFRPPIIWDGVEGRYIEKWVCYGNPFVGAKELTVLPGQTVTIKDKAAYGCVIIQGHGRFGAYADAEAAIMLRYGQLSGDEYFVSEYAAAKGVEISNNSRFEPLVILKHFGPNNPDMPMDAI
jgi:hypothetical protein